MTKRQRPSSSQLFKIACKHIELLKSLDGKTMGEIKSIYKKNFNDMMTAYSGHDRSAHRKALEKERILNSISVALHDSKNMTFSINDFPGLKYTRSLFDLTDELKILIERKMNSSGMSAPAISRSTGVSPTTIYRLKNGQIRKIGMAVLTPICDFYGIKTTIDIEKYTVGLG